MFRNKNIVFATDYQNFFKSYKEVSVDQQLESKKSRNCGHVILGVGTCYV